MRQTVVGIFDDSNAARNAVQRLTDSGFLLDDIDISSQEDMRTDSSDMSRTDRSDEGFGEKVSRFFRNLFDDEEDAERYSSIARSGSIVSVFTNTREDAERAAEILDEYGAINVDERANARLSAGAEGSADRIRTDVEETPNRSIPIIEEDLQVGKREVERGGMRLRSRIIDRPVEETLRLRQERVTVERTPVNRPATESDLDTFREGEVEVRERAEIPVVNKEARVVEEVNIRKDVEEREEVIRETVRKTDVEVDKLDDDTESTTNRTKSKN